MKRFLLSLSLVATLPVMAGIEAKAALAELPALAGEWSGNVVKPDGPKTTVDYRLTAGGQTVMEVLFGGTNYEMISMYHLDGPELVLTHFCAMADQPTMRLDRAASSADELVFVFAGGSNLNPEKDLSIHQHWLRFSEPGHLETHWTLFQEGKPSGTNSFFLVRGSPPNSGTKPAR